MEQQTGRLRKTFGAFVGLQAPVTALSLRPAAATTTDVQPQDDDAATGDLLLGVGNKVNIFSHCMPNNKSCLQLNGTPAAAKVSQVTEGYGVFTALDCLRFVPAAATACLLTFLCA